MWYSILAATIPAILTAVATYFLAVKSSKENTQAAFNSYKLEQRSHISKARFDTEFVMYQELSSSVLEMVSEVTALYSKEYPCYYEDPEVTFRKKCEHYDPALRATNSAECLVNRYAPFIDENNYALLTKIVGKCKEQTWWFPLVKAKRLKEGNRCDLEGCEDTIKSCYLRHDEVMVLRDELITTLRQYLKSL